MEDYPAEETRKLYTFERRIGLYETAGAIASYGDVIDFVDGPRPGIAIVDTCGHEEELGRDMAAFLRREIVDGWAQEGTAEGALMDLGQKLKAMQDPNDERFMPDEFYYYVSAQYCQFEGEDISVAIGGGIGPAVVFRPGQEPDEQHTQGGVIDETYLIKHRPPCRTVLAPGELLLLQSDGLIGNYFYSQCLKEEDKPRDERCADRECSVYELYGLLQQHLDDSPVAIRDAFISQFGNEFLPRDRRFDDVTFVVVKRA